MAQIHNITWNVYFFHDFSRGLWTMKYNKWMPLYFSMSDNDRKRMLFYTYYNHHVEHNNYVLCIFFPLSFSCIHNTRLFDRVAGIAGKQLISKIKIASGICILQQTHCMLLYKWDIYTTKLRVLKWFPPVEYSVFNWLLHVLLHCFSLFQMFYMLP